MSNRTPNGSQVPTPTIEESSESRGSTHRTITFESRHQVTALNHTRLRFIHLRRIQQTPRRSRFKLGPRRLVSMCACRREESRSVEPSWVPVTGTSVEFRTLYQDRHPYRFSRP